MVSAVSFKYLGPARIFTEGRKNVLIGDVMSQEEANRIVGENQAKFSPHEAYGRRASRQMVLPAGTKANQAAKQLGMRLSLFRRVLNAIRRR